MPSPADVTAAAAQLALWLLLSPSAGRLREAAWLAIGVLLPPALAVWGRSVLWGIGLAAAALQLAAYRRWQLLALLTGAAVAGDAAAWLWAGRPRPPPAPW